MEFDINKLIEKAGILIEALPYIQRLWGKTVVIKYGGHAMINDDLKHSVMEDITLLKFIGMNPIIVHGGGPDISRELEQNHVKSSFVNGLRVTDAQTMQIAQRVLVGKTNKEIVSLMNLKGGKAIGLCGIDGNLIECDKMTAQVDGKAVDIGFVGHIINVNTKILNLVISDEYIPVIAPIGVDGEGNSYNINADTVASEIAKAIKAEKLIQLTDIDGVHDENNEIIFEMDKTRALSLIADGTIAGGMIPKVESCVDAIKSGVNRVHIIDGRIPHCILLEIFTDTGIGTMITR